MFQRNMVMQLSLNEHCNLRCKQCHIWMSNASTDKYFGPEQEQAVVKFAEYCQINGRNGLISISGGEPLLNLDAVLNLASMCRKLRLQLSMTTNGTLVTEEVATALREHGPDHITVSIDSADPEIHDYIRGRPGTLEKAVNALRLLSVRDQLTRRSMIVNAQSILMKRTVPDLYKTIELAKLHGARFFYFQPLMPTFDCHSDTDQFYEQERFSTDEERKQAVDDITSILDLASKNMPHFVGHAQQDIQALFAYLMGDKLETSICNSHEKNVILSKTGEVELCFFMKDKITNGQRLPGNLFTDSLQSILTSEFAKSAAEKMSKCQESCGLLGCHRKTRRD